ncbi:MAG: hypothetical protein K2X93_03515 [Candidatus Obscuribacterales bacterium]|nr:hypothetical protein [Candidatus Obscuribacterales bacterium]
MQSSDSSNKWVPDDPTKDVSASNPFNTSANMPSVDTTTQTKDDKSEASEETGTRGDGICARERLVSEVFGSSPEVDTKPKGIGRKAADEALEYLSITPLGVGSKPGIVDFTPPPYSSSGLMPKKASTTDGRAPAIVDGNARAADKEAAVNKDRIAEPKDRSGDRAARDAAIKSKTTSLGGRVSEDGDGNVVRIGRGNGSSATGVYDQDNKLIKVTENTRDGALVTWTKDANSWNSDTKPPQTRTNLNLEKNGNLTFKTGDGVKHIIRSDGTELQERKGLSKFSFDDRGRIKELQSANGTMTRKFEYSGTSNQIAKEERVSSDGKTPKKIWAREGSSDRWTEKDTTGKVLSKWEGETKIYNDGTYAIRSKGASAPKDGAWDTLRPDGQKFKEKVSADGTRSAYDAAGTLRAVVRTDGHRIDSATAKNGSINEVTLTDTSKGTKVTWKKNDSGLWKSDAEKPETVKNLKFNEKSELRHSDSAGVVTRRVDGSRQLDKHDGSKIEYRKDGLVSRVASPTGAERKFLYDGKNNVSSVIDKDERGVRVWKDSDAKSETRKNSKVSPTGDLSFELPSGKKVVERASGVRYESDEGKLSKVLLPNGSKREIEYKDGKLSQVTDTIKSAKGDTVQRYKKLDGGDEKFRLIDKTGKIIPGLDGRAQDFKDLKVTESGVLRGKDREGKERSIGLPERLSETTFNNKDRDIKSARDAFLDVMKGQLDQPRLDRMQSMLKSFEDRMQDRADVRKLAGVKSTTEIEAHHKKAVSETYKNLAEMVRGDKPEQFYDQATRVKLAENFMYHAQEPMTSDQGTAEDRDKKGHGTCWINSASVWGMTQHPNAMADMLKQISLEGEYTTKNSGEMGNLLTAGRADSPPRTVKFSKDLLSFAGKQENEWSISAATDMWGRSGSTSRWVEGDRSPVSRIFDYTLPVLGGRAEGEIDGGIYRSGRSTEGRTYVGSRDIMLMVTGDTPVDMALKDYSHGHLIDGDFNKSVLEKGTVLNYSPGHGMSQTLRRINGEWCLIQDNQHGESGDRIIQRINNIERWARGESGSSRKVNDAVPYKSYKLWGGEAEFGAVKARSRR